MDVNLQLRVRSRATVGGGWNIGNAVQLGTTAGGTASASTNSCYVVDSPQQLFNCDVEVPYQNRIKLNGSYSLPWDVQIAAVLQSNPGANYSANLAYTSAQIQPSLGRALSGATTVTIPLAQPLLAVRSAHQPIRSPGHEDLPPWRATPPVECGRVQPVQHEHARHALRHLQCPLGTADAGARWASREVQRTIRVLGNCSGRCSGESSDSP